jgi:hypothetical protein
LLIGYTVYVAVAGDEVVLTRVWLTDVTAVLCAEPPVILPAGEMTGADHVYVVPAGRLVAVPLNELLLHIVVAVGACIVRVTPRARPWKPVLEEVDMVTLVGDTVEIILALPWVALVRAVQTTVPEPIPL